jgi:hypothetical protein
MNARTLITYTCDECGEEYDDEEIAECCCQFDEAGRPIVSRVELERAGQQALFGS